MSNIIPLLYLAKEQNRRREQNFRQFFDPNSLSFRTQANSENSDQPTNVALDKVLLRILETGRFSDVQFLVGENEYCFNCHKAIVGCRSEVLAIAMEQRWADNDVVPDKTVVRLPETDVEVFKVFLKYLYSDELSLMEMSDEHIIDLLLKVMSLAHMYQVDGLLKECVTQLTPKINVRTCWTIHKECRLIAPSLSERSFQFLCDNIHEAAARIEYLKWDAETVRRILSLDRSFVSELNLFVALINWQKFPTGPLEPPRTDVFRESLLTLIRFPAMNLASFSKVIKTNVFSQSEAGRLRRYITNPNPRRRNTSIYSCVPRFTDIHSFKLLTYQGHRRTTACSDDWWSSADDDFMELIKSNRAEFSIETNTPTTISSLLLHNAIKRSSVGIQCKFNLRITFYLYIGQSIMHEEERSVIIGGPSYTGPLIPFVLRQPFKMAPGRIYEFHVLYELLEDDEGMVNEYERYEYEVTWSSLSRLDNVINRRIAHGIVFKMNYKVEDDDNDDDDEVDHDKTPRWIHSVNFNSELSQNCEQMCAVS